MLKLRSKQCWTKEARRFFRLISDGYHIDAKHYSTFYATIENLDRFYLANEIIKKEGLTFQTETGQVRRHPACQISKDSWSSFLLGLKALGLHEYQAKLGRPPGG